MSEAHKGIIVRTYILNKKTAYKTILKNSGVDMWKSEVEGLIKGINNATERIYNRRKQIDGFGIVYAEGKFVDLLVEIISSYELGLYYSTIALCGMAAERICYDFVDFSKIVINGKELDATTKRILYHIPQNKMIEFLAKIGIADDKSRKVLFKISELRNAYIHPKMSSNPERDALKAINLLCSAIENLLSMFKYFDIKDGQFVRKQNK